MKRRIGTIQTSAVGMGCWAIGGEWTLDGSPTGWGKTDDRESIAALEAAYEAGIRFFDTAANYGAGSSERLVAAALAGKPRDYLVATKFGFAVDEKRKAVSNYGEMRTADVLSHLRDDCEASLRRLDTDCIDLYLFHIWDYDPDLAAELREELEILVHEGKIRMYGWSTDDLALMKIFAEGEHCAAFEHNLNVVYGRGNPGALEETLRFLEERTMASIDRAPLAMGFLTGKYTDSSTFAATDVRADNEWTNSFFRRPALGHLDAIRDILTAGGRTLAQGSLAWILAKSPATVPIPGIRTVRQAQENAAVLEQGPLSAQQMEEIERILAGEVL